MDRDDVALVQAMARGESPALAAIYDRYARLMVSVALRMLSDPAAAEDLVHDVLIEAWRHADRYDPGRASVRTWLLVRLRSRALDQLRSQTVRRDASSRIQSQASAQPLEADGQELSPDHQAVRRALTELPEAQRLVLELSYFQGLSASEIAEEMGSPIGTVKSRTAAALSRIRALMGTGGDGL